MEAEGGRDPSTGSGLSWYYPSKLKMDSLRLTVLDSGEEQINWLEIASRVEGRSNKDCRKRWVYSLSSSIKKGSWEEWEDAALREGVLLHGTRYVSAKKPARQ